MGDSCQQPDIRNRYEGRGSGDRIARLKANATRSGPAPVVNSASWNLTRQQGCCCPTCVAYDFILINSSTPIQGTLIGSNIVFNVAKMEGECRTTAACTYTLRFGEPSTIPYQTNSPVRNCEEWLTITIPEVDYTSTITLNDIVINYGRDNTICPVGAGGEDTVTLILEYNP